MIRLVALAAFSASTLLPAAPGRAAAADLKPAPLGQSFIALAPGARRLDRLSAGRAEHGAEQQRPLSFTATATL
jgi:hypothetical protein